MTQIKNGLGIVEGAQKNEREMLAWPPNSPDRQVFILLRQIIAGLQSAVGHLWFTLEVQT